MPWKCRQQCYSCNPAPLENKTSGCVPVRRYERLTVSEHGRLAGRSDMMAEIKARGPITCAINATSGLDKCATYHAQRTLPLSVAFGNACGSATR